MTMTAMSRFVVLLLLAACGDETEESPTGEPTVVMQPIPPAEKEEPAPPPPAPPETEDATAEAHAVRERWLRGTLRGHDNNMARMRSVTITATDAGYAIRVANQFRFRCGLEFGEDGRPARMTRCRGEQGWQATPEVIDLECETRTQDELCSGSYMLGTTDGYRQRARFQIIRPLESDERG